MSETNGSVGAVIILLLNAFEQSAILTVSYVICKASISKIMFCSITNTPSPIFIEKSTCHDCLVW